MLKFKISETYLTNSGVFKNKLIKILTFITFILIALHITNGLLGKPFWQITRLVSLGEEANLPTWFSSTILAIAAYFSYKCSLSSIRSLKNKNIWRILSFVLIFMSCDETAQIHESLGNAINDYLVKSKAIEHSAWSIIFGPIIILMFLVFIFYLVRCLKNSDKALRYIIIGSSLYIFSALIVESSINLLNHNELSWIWRTENLIEESGEMFGIIIIINGLSEHLKFLSKDQ